MGAGHPKNLKPKLLTEGQLMAARRRAGKASRKKLGPAGLGPMVKRWERNISIARRYE